MIVIVGSSHDDILYFDSILSNRKEVMILNRYQISIGTIFNQEVLVVHEAFSSILASSIMMHIFDKYYVDLVFCVGKCIAASSQIKSGDIVISSKIIDTNVDLSLFSDSIVGQFPGFSREFVVQRDILEYLNKGTDRRSYVNTHRVVMLTNDNMSYDMMQYLKEQHELFGIKNELFAIDHNSSGVALAATLRDVPFITIKVAENRVDQRNNVETYYQVLERFIDLGKAVISTINDIGRNDILEEGEMHE